MKRNAPICKIDAEKEEEKRRREASRPQNQFEIKEGLDLNTADAMRAYDSIRHYTSRRLMMVG
jgi:hypothetical protein